MDDKNLRHQSVYKMWRAEIYARDNWRCVLCSSKERIEAHHIKPYRSHPELRLKISNGVTLCFDCHRTIYGKEEQLEAHFQEIVKNAVNSGELPLGDAKDNPEPSRDRNDSEGVTTRRRGFDIKQFENKVVNCVVCNEEKEVHHYRYIKSKVFFCSRGCRSKFMKSEDRFVKPRTDKMLDKRCKYCNEVLKPNSTGHCRYKTYCNPGCKNRYQIEVMGYDLNAQANKHKLEGKWSRKYDKCIECGKTENKHESHGKCRKCYQTTYNKENWRKYTASNSSTSAVPERDDIV